jgi:hypothetical protein
MRFKSAVVLIASGLSLAAIPAFAEIIEVNAGQSVHTRIMRGAPDRCGMSGPVIIHLGDAHNQKQVRCATPVTYRDTIGTQVNNFVVVFLADGHKRHYKPFH